MAKLDFYFSPGACSLATHICLEEAGASFNPKPTYTRKGQTRTPEYLALNPKGKVPLLIVPSPVLMPFQPCRRAVQKPPAALF